MNCHGPRSAWMAYMGVAAGSHDVPDPSDEGGGCASAELALALSANAQKRRNPNARIYMELSRNLETTTGSKSA
jgi:hypothetical protein